MGNRGKHKDNGHFEGPLSKDTPIRVFPFFNWRGRLRQKIGLGRFDQAGNLVAAKSQDRWGLIQIPFALDDHWLDNHKKTHFRYFRHYMGNVARGDLGARQFDQGLHDPCSNNHGSGLESFGKNSILLKRPLDHFHDRWKGGRTSLACL